MTFPNTNFQTGTVITSAWLNAVNDACQEITTNVLHVENFSGDGTQTVFVSTYDTVNEDYISIYIDGAYQQKNTYSYNTSTQEITFSEAPPLGTDNIEVVTSTPTIVGETSANLVEYDPPFVGSVATTVEDKLAQTISVKDFGGDLTAAIAAAKANNQCVGISENTIIRIPTDASVLQDAFDYTTPLNDTVQITVNIETGHSPATGVLLENGDWGQYSISSTDAEVSVTSGLIAGFLVVSNGRAPVLDCLVNMAASSSFDSYMLTAGAVGVINSGCGIKNGTRGLHVQNASMCFADGAIFTGFQEAGLHVSRASTCQCTGATFSGNSQDPANTFGGVYASRSSSIHGASIDASNSGGDGVRAQKLATISIPGVDVSNSTGIALVAVSGGSIYSDSDAPVMLNLQSKAIVAQQGSKIIIASATIEFDTGVTAPAIESRGASIISITSCTISGHQGIGVFATADGIIDATGSSITGGSNGLWSERGGKINAASVTVTNASTYGAYARLGGFINLSSASITNSTTKDLAIDTGSWMSANGCSTTAGSGTPNVANTNLTGGFNFADNGNRGFIWN